ncbi:hypothetical protein U1Q18_025755 [Sarracenia purpurea var. burkii]
MLMQVLGFGICRFDGLVLYTWIRWCFDLGWLFLQSFVWLLVLGDLGVLKFHFIASFTREEAAGFLVPLSFAGLSECLWWMLLGLAIFDLMDQCRTLGFDGILIMVAVMRSFVWSLVFGGLLSPELLVLLPQNLVSAAIYFC